MKLAKIRILFKDGNIGWYINRERITSFEDTATTFSLEYAQGLAQGLNDCIKIFEDDKTLEAQVVAY